MPLPPPPRRRRLVPIALALVGASLLAVAVQGGEWWVVGSDASIGPISSTACFGDGACEVKGLAWLDGGELWMRLGVATYAAAALAAALLIALAGAVAAKRSATLLAQVTGVAVVTAAGPAVAFAVTFPGLERASLGRGLWLDLAGVVVGLIAVAVTLRTRSA